MYFDSVRFMPYWNYDSGMFILFIAGSVMYEYGMRLGSELPGQKGLQRQAKCYLAAMNALRLVDSDYAWIVKPVPSLKQVRFHIESF